MKAIVFDGTVRLDQERPRPEPLPGEALLRVLVAGVCNTDVEITRGYLGFAGVPGHEFTAVVEAVNGPDPAGLTGQRVVGGINAGCGACAWCARGLSRHCSSRTVLGILGRDGAMAEYATLPASNLVPLPEAVTDEAGVFAEPLAAAFEITEQAHVGPDDRVLVLGDGKLGQLCAQALALTQARVDLAGRHPAKLALAASRGIQTLMPDQLPSGRLYDMVVEATGRPGGLMQALGLVRPRGIVVLKSTLAAGAPMNLAPLVIDEITLLGSRCGPFGPAVRALASGAVDVTTLVEAVYPADRAVEAFAHASQPGTLKILIDFRV
jgi:threonine dehydrogenase-like Zn-dependent dehydrogenase